MFKQMLFSFMIAFLMLLQSLSSGTHFVANVTLKRFLPTYMFLEIIFSLGLMTTNVALKSELSTMNKNVPSQILFDFSCEITQCTFMSALFIMH